MDNDAFCVNTSENLKSMNINIESYRLSNSERENFLSKTILKASRADAIRFGEVIRKMIQDQFVDHENIKITIRFKKLDNFYVDYSEIKNPRLKNSVKDYLLSKYPIVF